MFCYRNGELYCGRTAVEEIVGWIKQETGEATPAYIYSLAGILNNCSIVRMAFPKADIRFAVKACMNISILDIMRQSGFGFDVVSSVELGRALKTGIDASQIVYAGAAKTDKEIYEAVKLGVTLVVECPEEFSVIERAAAELRTQPELLLRIRPGVDAHTHSHLTTGQDFSKFGMPIRTAREILGGRRSSQIIGLHVHIGSQIEGPDRTGEALDVVLPIIDEYQLAVLDIGGGFPVAYKDSDIAPHVSSFANVANDKIGDRTLKLIIEPGRRLVADTAILATSVMAVETGTNGDGKKWRIVRCDAGMGDLARPMLYGAYHPIRPIIQSLGIVKDPTSLGGPFCESADFLGSDREDLPELKRGDLLAVDLAGAYGRSMASGYNGNLIGPEVLVTPRGEIHLIGRREDFNHSVDLDTQVQISASYLT